MRIADSPYKELFQHKVAEGWEWYKAIPFVCAALARHIYHCLKFNAPHDVKRAFRCQELRQAGFVVRGAPATVLWPAPSDGLDYLAEMTKELPLRSER